ncbi:MAG: 50S ribosomal protein L25 [Candidatus Magasanikbacteria bacterium]|nr:50S ribosomal protein L25 [Candidatus Magasanikbacteria bacterium]
MSYSLNAKTRPAGQAEVDRASGNVPAVVYGGDRSETTVVTVALNEFTKVYNEARSSLIDLTIDGSSPVKVVVQDVQFNPVKDLATHVDFRQINMSKEMSTTVALLFVGEAPAVKELGGTIMKMYTEVDVTCLPKDLVQEIEIDVSGLKTFDDGIRIKDIVVPAGITLDEDMERVVVKVTPPLTEDELKAMEEPAAVDLAAIEVEKKGKKDEEAGAEGAEAAK